MKAFKGTFVVIAFLLGLCHSASAASLYLSYEKRLVPTYLLAGAGETPEKQIELAERLEKTVHDFFKKPVEEIKVSHFPEFLKAYQGPWPQSYSVKSDLELIESGQLRGPVVYRAIQADGSANPQLQIQIDQFVTSQLKSILNRVEIRQAPFALLVPIAQILLRQESPLDKRIWILEGFEAATQMLNEQFSQLEKVGNQIATSGKLANLDPAMRMFLETVLQQYFSRMGMDSKKLLISRFLGMDLNSSSMHKFETMLMSAGPQFQKLLQILAGNSSINGDLQRVLKKLESKVLPIPPAIAQKVIEAERRQHSWVRYDLEPLGTGTMAQVHRGVLRTSRGEEDVVIRFLKPEIALRVHEDSRILAEIAQLVDGDPRYQRAGLPKLTPLVQDLNQTVMDELNVPLTSQRQKMGREVYNGSTLIKVDGYKTSLRIQVPRVIEGRHSSSLMVQELVHGRKLDKEILTYAEVLPKLGRVLSEELAKVWTQQAFFGSGFFHSDLHQGNYLVNVTDAEITVSLMDFGMGGRLTKEMQSNLIFLAVALQLDRAELVTQALWDLSLQANNSIHRTQLQAAVNARLAAIRKGFQRSEDLNQWMRWAINQDMRFPYEMVSLNRGMEILDQALKEVGSSSTVSSLALQLAPKNVGIVLSMLRSKGVLTNADYLKLGISALRDSPTPAPTALSCAKVHRARAH